LESQAKNQFGAANWSRLKFHQQRSRLSSIIRQKFLNEDQDSLLNLEMQGAAHRSVIQGSQEFDWMYNLTGLSKSLLKFGINGEFLHLVRTN
jgi:hypothetical protein